MRRDLPPRLLLDLMVGAAPAVRERLLASATLETQAEMRRILAELADDAQASSTPRDYAGASAQGPGIASRRQAG